MREIYVHPFCCFNCIQKKGKAIWKLLNKSLSMSFVRTEVNLSTKPCDLISFKIVVKCPVFKVINNYAF